MWSRTQSDNERGQSSPIAVVLVFGLVIASTTFVVLAGGSAIQSTQSQLGTASAENSMTQLDSQASLVALGQSGSQQVDLGTNGDSSYDVNETAGEMTITNESGGEIFSSDLGKITHESDDGETIAYQGGGVWRSSGAGESVMVSPPEFHYRGATLTLPIVTINHGEQITDRAVIRRDNTAKHYPNETRGNINPVDEGPVTVTVKSEYYRAWGKYFEERTSGSVDHDPENNTVKLDLTVESDGQSVPGGLISSDASSKLAIQPMTVVDSYDSSVNEYSSSKSDSAEIYTSGEIEMRPGSKIKGSVVINDTLTMNSNGNNKPKITGDLTHGGSVPSNPEVYVDGDINSGADVPTLKPVDGKINNKTSDFQSTNDNTDHSSNISALESRNACEPCNLTAGQYYLDSFDLKKDDQVYLKPEGDTIQIAVNKNFYTGNNSNIEVIGDGRVEFYVQKEASLDSKTEVANEGDDAPQFWLYLKSDNSFTLKNNGTFTGVVYGPNTDSTTGVKIDTKPDAEIYGAVVGDMWKFHPKTKIHYDSALADSTATDGGSGTEAPPLTYLHITENEVNVTSG